MKFLLLLLIVSCGKKVTVIQGAKGLDGISCISESRTTGNYVVCGDNEFKVENGSNGQKGDAGEKGDKGEDGTFAGVVELVQLCPEINGSYIESLLFLDGQYMAFLSDNDYMKQRLVTLTENQLFTTTDGRNLQFQIINSEIYYLDPLCLN